MKKMRSLTFFLQIVHSAFCGITLWRLYHLHLLKCLQVMSSCKQFHSHSDLRCPSTVIHLMICAFFDQMNWQLWFYSCQCLQREGRKFRKTITQLQTCYFPRDYLSIKLLYFPLIFSLQRLWKVFSSLRYLISFFRFFVIF